VNTRIASFVAFVSMSLATAMLAKAETYTIDPVHSMVVFKINHLNVSNTLGRFDGPTGTLTTNDDPGKMAFDVSVAVNNVDTGNPKRDQHLKTSDFFDAKQFPDITFKSTGIQKTGDNTYNVTGDMTIHGVTKSITVTLNKVGEANTPAGQRAGFDGTFSVKRSDYGMNSMQGMVGDDVTLFINLEGVKS
jgi:polyisoprenoid-binding protein YceI